jgi:DMSO/TMAO reductase YedYZ molybdopterin-dependent catalytic subunit
VLNAVAPLLAAEPSASLRDFAPARRPRRARWPSVAGLTQEITSVADHYIVQIDITPPVIDASSWRLAVGGLVRRPLALTFDELQRRFEPVSEYAVLTCISNPVAGPLVGNSLWGGVRLIDLLDAAGASPRAWGLAVSCADGYTAGIPLPAARHPGHLSRSPRTACPSAATTAFPAASGSPHCTGCSTPNG